MKKSLLLINLLLITLPALCFADGESVPPRAKQTPNEASDASFDKRLPPVLPGEEVSDGNKTIKIWSTSGPVPVSEAPEPWKKKDGINGTQGLSVVVDQRKDAATQATRNGGGNNGGAADNNGSNTNKIIDLRPENER